MEKFLQVLAGVLLTVVLGIAISRQNKDITLLLTTAACCMVVTAAAGYLRPVMDLVGELQILGDLDPKMMQSILKAVGICLLAEISALICTDAGNAALGKAIQLLASAVVLWLSLPLISGLLDMVQRIMGEI